jgi:hypothetical protein
MKECDNSKTHISSKGKTRSFVISTAEAQAVFVHALKAYEGSGGSAPCTNRVKVNGQPHGPTTSPPWKDPLNMKLTE